MSDHTSYSPWRGAVAARTSDKRPQPVVTITLAPPLPRHKRSGSSSAIATTKMHVTAEIDPSAPVVAKLLARNTRMLDVAGDDALVLAVRNGRDGGGTWDTVRKARERGMTIAVLDPGTWRLRPDEIPTLF